jgi:thiol-disulfide isomerase/thioredoxin
MNRRLASFALLLILAPGAPVASAAQDPRPFGAASLATIREQYAGRPFVLAFWATHCEPCQRDMGLWREMAAKHPDVAIVLVATDPPAAREGVRKFLARYDPGRVERWWFADDFEERTRFAVDPKWRGELPRTYFYDAKHRVTARTGALESSTVEDWFRANAGVR